MSNPWRGRSLWAAAVVGALTVSVAATVTAQEPAEEPSVAAVSAAAEGLAVPALPFDRPGLLPGRELSAAGHATEPYCGVNAYDDSEDDAAALDIVRYELNYDCNNELMAAVAQFDRPITASEIRRYELWIDSDLDPATGCLGADYLALVLWRSELGEFTGGLFQVGDCELASVEIVAPVGYVVVDAGEDPSVGLVFEGAQLDDVAVDGPGPPIRMRWYQQLWTLGNERADRSPDEGWELFTLPAGADRLVVGDWNFDGVDTVGVVRGDHFLLTDLNEGAVPERRFSYGFVGAEVFTGDWDGDGIDTPAHRIGNVFHMRNENDAGEADATQAFGRPGDEVLVGDWDGDGRDTFAVRRGATFFVTNGSTPGPAEIEVTFGRPSDTVLVGDWDGDGRDSPAVRRGTQLFIVNELRSGPADLSFRLGAVDDQIIAGDWNGDGSDTFGIRRDRELRLFGALDAEDPDQVFDFGR